MNGEIERLEADGLSFVPIQRACRDNVVETAKLAESGPCLMGCTQEASIFQNVSNLAQDFQTINLRGILRGQASNNSKTQMAAALAAKAAYSQAYRADPVPAVLFRSHGHLAVVSDDDFGFELASTASSGLDVEFLVKNANTLTLTGGRSVQVAAVEVTHAQGYLGDFTLKVKKSNPVDTELCTRCGACADACPTQSISRDSLTINLDSCDKSGACIKACGSFQAISFADMDQVSERNCELLIDCTEEGLFADRQAPLGYWHVGRSHALLAQAMLEAVQMVGEFEKPKFFSYTESLCAHSRSEKLGCNNCIDTCSTKAISSAGKGIKVNPQLCLGCGTCTAVCPTGAIQYAYSPVVSIGTALKVALKVFKDNGGQRAEVVLHQKDMPSNWMEQAKRLAHKPAQNHSTTTFIPVELHHGASMGPDLWLSAVAYGAERVSVVITPEEHKHYFSALSGQAAWVNVVLKALGMGPRIRILSSGSAHELFESEASSLTTAPVSIPQASFAMADNKRSRLEFAFEHLLQHALTPPVQAIPLPKGAPFGAVLVNKDKCTLCLSCTGACPSSALIDNPLEPQLRFIERNCVQCGLCQTTCPENAIELVPQLNLLATAKGKQVLNESQPFHCIKCAKAFGTKHMIESMLSRLAGHSMFQDNANRLKMCADCRVTDMYSRKDEMTIFEVKP
jgi:ferredoxin